MVLAFGSPVRKKHETGSQKACSNLGFASNMLCVALEKYPQKRSSNPYYLMNVFTESLKDFKNKVSDKKCDTTPSIQSVFYIIGIL